MKLRPIEFLLLSLALGACGGSDTANPGGTSQPAVRAIPSNQDIVQRVYDNNYSVPDGFFVDERAATPQSYSLYHVKDSSLSYELCSDDFAEALAWEDADNESRSVSGHYVGSYENPMYFEFIRELVYNDSVGNAGDTSPGFARVFKCSSIDRNGVDRNLRDGYAGVLNTRPLSAATVRIFAEYLWQFVFFETTQRKVLQSYTTERAGSIDHTLVIAVAFNQGSERCDRIEVIDWVFSADKATGEVSKAFNFLFSLEARNVGGVPLECN